MNNSKGFTLIELMIVVTILSLVLTSLSGVLNSSLNLWNRVNNQVELQHNLRFAVNKIAGDIKKAKGILPGSNEDELILKMSEDQIIKYGLKEDIRDDEHPYYLTGKELYLEKNAGNREPVVNFVQDLVFTYDTDDPQDAKYVKITIQGALKNKTIVYSSGAEVKWQSFGSLNQ